MRHNKMPRIVRLSLATAGVLVFAGAPTAVAAPSEATPESEVTSTSMVPTTTTTTTAAPTTTPKRYVSRQDSEEDAPTSMTTAPTTTTTVPAVPEAPIPTTSSTAPTGRAGLVAVAAEGRSGLSIINGGPLGTIVPGAKSASGTLTTVTVSDSGTGTRGWVATATSTDFVGPYGTIPKSAVTYRATALAGELAGGDLSSKGSQSLEAPKAVVERSGLYWPYEVITWTPSLRVDYPDGAAVGSYTGTITISVA